MRWVRICFIFLFTLSGFISYGQGEGGSVWICDDWKFRDADSLVEPLFRLELLQGSHGLTGSLKVFLDGELVKYSELTGIYYRDGSAALSERWSVKLRELDWYPLYVDIIIPDLNAMTFPLHWNSSTSGRSHQDKGQVTFKRLTGTIRS
jgi:hypothetical protein